MPPMISWCQAVACAGAIHFAAGLELTGARLGVKKDRWETDDLLDAFAALWTALRIVDGTALEIPTVPERDELGIPMRMFA